MGLLDRAIGLAEQLAPAWGLRRAYARHAREVLNMGYSQHGASRQKESMAGWVTGRGGPDADITLNLDLLRQRSRDLCMGEPLALGALKTIRVNEVGSGLRLNAQIDQEFLGLDDEKALAWEQHTEREFASWANNTNCDAAQLCTFGELVALARLSEMMSGDVFALLPSIPRKGTRYDLRVKLVEADQISDPWPYPVGKNVLGGVEVGEHGEPLAYYIAKHHPGDLFLPGSYGGYGAYAYGAVNVPPMTEGGIYGAQWNTWERVEAFGKNTGRRMVLHVMEAERPGQRRGVPLLAPVMERLKQLSRYSDAEIMAAVVAGMFTAAITTTRADGMPGAVLPVGQQIQQAPDANNLQLAPGSIISLAPGEDLKVADPGRPNSGFEQFVRAVSQQIGAGLGIPYELLVMQFTASYSASRGALLEAWKRFAVGRERMATRFCQPVYEQWLEEAVARGYVDAPGFFRDPLVRAAWCGAEWHGPTQGQLDPVKEAEAAEKRVQSGFSTRTREAAELTGGNFERMHKVRVREERLRRDGQVVPAAPAPGGAAAPSEPPPAETDPKEDAA